MSALTGGFTDPAIQSAQGFRILMQAMAHPGTIHDLTLAAPPAPLGRAAGTVLLLLADPTCPVHLAAPAPDLAEWLRFHAGCPLSGPETAALALGRWSDLQPLDRFPVGLPDYPDRSATLIVELDRLENDGPRLTGPGIKGHARLSLPETAAFRANRALFPRGLDVILTCGDRLACLPRSTIVEDC
ncbi:phosphonate C-P lyase system protein PhnH [Paracoccus liaowanqingii]|uniref:Phosphonate C-P lyase system protein PhnH n=1 Tax=Paracoccus liaowanqingii TaxID=2560053 RepID=A0A4P7HPS3_9RHOB|nr:phosphonate C-P lyase system protein PhnH [Paracoccus liaowanqingii]QBX35281.1 phosphonate C-P lyase system protein PhnH [Paracoccus liaowanqingii]